MTLAWRAAFNRWRRQWLRLWHFRMVFGERSQGRLLPNTRISPSCCIEHEAQLTLGDHVFIGPFCFLEASAGLVIEQGVQITSQVSIVTHSSHRALRLLGAAYTDWRGERPGWIASAVRIGAYSFIGPHVLIGPGTELGAGTIVRAGSVVRGKFPAFSVLEGAPATIVGDARDGDTAWLDRFPELRESYERLWAAHAAPNGER